MVQQQPVGVAQVGASQMVAAVAVFATAVAIGFALGMARPRRTFSAGPGFGDLSATRRETDPGGV